MTSTLPPRSKYVVLSENTFTLPSPTPIPSEYEIRTEVPSVETYLDLRVKSGMSPKTQACAEIGLKNGLYSCVIVHKATNQIIGMGRLVGDGGCFVNIVDIGVLPSHQKKGLGKAIMDNLMKWIVENVPDFAFVALYANGGAKTLYARYGFRETGLFAVGMMVSEYDLEVREGVRFVSLANEYLAHIS